MKGSITLPTGHAYELSLWDGTGKKGSHFTGNVTAKDLDQALKDKNAANDSAPALGVPPAGLDLQPGRVVLFQTPAESLAANAERPTYYGYVRTGEGWFRISAWKRDGAGLTGSIDINQARAANTEQPELKDADSAVEPATPTATRAAGPCAAGRAGDRMTPLIARIRLEDRTAPCWSRAVFPASARTSCFTSFTFSKRTIAATFAHPCPVVVLCGAYARRPHVSPQSRTPAHERKAAMTEEKGMKPTHRIVIVQGTEDKPFFLEIGAAWPNKKGTGFNLRLSALPIDGRLEMIENKEADAKSKAA